MATTGGRTSVLAAGPADGPPVVLPHGDGGTATAWASVTAQLSGRFQVHAPDQPGNPGRSSGSRPFRTTSDLVSWLDELLAAGNPGPARVRRFLAWETRGRVLDPRWLATYVQGATAFERTPIVPTRRPAARRLAGPAVPLLVVVAASGRAHDAARVARSARSVPPGNDGRRAARGDPPLDARPGCRRAGRAHGRAHGRTARA